MYLRSSINKLDKVTKVKRLVKPLRNTCATLVPPKTDTVELVESICSEYHLQHRVAFRKAVHHVHYNTNIYPEPNVWEIPRVHYQKRGGQKVLFHGWRWKGDIPLLGYLYKRYPRAIKDNNCSHQARIYKDIPDYYTGILKKRWIPPPGVKIQWRSKPRNRIFNFLRNNSEWDNILNCYYPPGVFHTYNT